MFDRAEEEILHSDLTFDGYTKFSSYAFYDVFLYLDWTTNASHKLMKILIFNVNMFINI